MTSFSSLVAEFAEKTGVTPGNPGADNFDIVADGILVSVQYRQDKDDCIIFTLPLRDMEPDPAMLRRALELAANGAGTGGHFLGIKEGMFVLSAIVPLAGLSAEDFGKRLIALADVSHRVGEQLALAVGEAVTAANASLAAPPEPDKAEDSFIRV